MGAFQRDGEHFLRWAQRAVPEAASGQFPPRRLYGDYLVAVLAEAESRARPGIEVVTVRDDAIGAVVEAYGPRPGVTVHLRDGAPLRAAGEDTMLMVGTGLTMIDLALLLGTPGGPRRLRAVSRNGLLPHAHTSGPSPSPLAYDLPNVRLQPRCAAGRGRAAHRRGRRLAPGDRLAAPGDQPHLAAARRSRPRAFVSEVARHWEVRRHRMAPEIGAALDTLLDSGHLPLQAASILSMRPVAGGIEVALADGETFTVDRVVNCTGPSLQMGIAGEPLLAARCARATRGRRPRTPEIRAETFALADLLTAQLTSRSAQAGRAA